MFQAQKPWQKPLWRRMTLRTALVLGTAGFVLFYPLYYVLEAAITHGIHRRGDLLVVDLHAMSNFNLDQQSGRDTDIPQPYRELDGKRVELAGEIWAPDSAANLLNRFQLCYSIASCCFSGPPRIQHFVKATVMPGRDIEYTQGIVNVIGTLHVGVERAGDQVTSVYRMDVEKVEP
jgi:hypothetical protein